MVKSWQEKEIIFPEELIFTKYGKDTVKYNIPVSDYKIIMYVDSVGCTECKLQLYKWKDFITEVDSLTNGAVPILFFFYPKDLREISFLLKRDSINIPVCIDKQNRMNRINHFPSHQMYQCFLVNKENKVICIGNPVHNRKIRDIYLSTISNGKHNPSVQPSGITRIEADKTEFDLGSLKKKVTAVKSALRYVISGNYRLLYMTQEHHADAYILTILSDLLFPVTPPKLILPIMPIRRGLFIKQSLSTAIWTLRH